MSAPHVVVNPGPNFAIDLGENGGVAGWEIALDGDCVFSIVHVPGSVICIIEVTLTGSGAVTWPESVDFTADSTQPGDATVQLVSLDGRSWSQIGGGSGGGGGSNGPLYLAPIDWIYLDQSDLGSSIDPYTYDDGSDGVGATVTQTTPSDGALTIDGGAPEVGDRVAFIDLTNDPTVNGIYTVTAVGDADTTPWQLTRATDNDSVALRLVPWSALVSPQGTGSVFGPGSAVTPAEFLDAGGVILVPNVMDSRSFATGGGVAIASGSQEGVAIGGSAVAQGAIAIGEGTVNLAGDGSLGLPNLTLSNLTIATELDLQPSALLRSPSIELGDSLQYALGQDLIATSPYELAPLTAGACLLCVDGADSVVLPDASLYGGYAIIIKNTISTDVVLSAADGQTIDGAATFTLHQNDGVQIYSDSIAGWWIILGNKAP